MVGLNVYHVGDCWFIAAAANLAMANRKLLTRCVPHDQDFTDDDYCGM